MELGGTLHSQYLPTSDMVVSDTLAMKTLKNDVMKIDDKIVTVETPIAADKPSKTGHSDTESQGFSHLGLNLESRFDEIKSSESTPSYTKLTNLPPLLRSIAKISEERRVPVQEVCDWVLNQANHCQIFQLLSCRSGTC